MPTGKSISQYETVGDLAENDLIPVVDISDTTMSDQGTTKKATFSDFKSIKTVNLVVAQQSLGVRADYYLDGVEDEDEINAAIAALPAAGGKISLVATTVTIDGAIIINKSNVEIEGLGIGATTITQKNKASGGGNIIEITGSGTVQAKIRNLTVDGNKSNVLYGSGIYITTPWQSGSWDPQHVIEDVRIYNCKNNGLHVVDSSDTRVLMVTRVIATRNDGNGFFMPAPSCTDGIFTDCIADTNLLSGFYIGCLNTTFTGCKAFYNGATAGENMGFMIVGYNNKFVNCEAQDNYQSGFYGNGAYGDATYHNQGNIFVSCVADSNGQGNNSTYQKGMHLIDCREWQIIGGRYLNAPYGSFKQNYGISLEGSTQLCVIAGITGAGNNYGLINDASTNANGNFYLENNNEFNVKDFGAKGDGKRIASITCTSGSKNVTVSGASFTQRDVGKKVVLFDTYNTTFTNSVIDTVTDATHIVIHDNASLSLTSDGFIIYGTDDAAAIQRCLTAAGAILTSSLTGATTEFYPTVGNPSVVIPAQTNDGLYIITSQLSVPAGVRLNSRGLIVNLLSDQYSNCIVLNQGVEVDHLRVDAMYGNGIKVGNGTNANGYTQNIKIHSVDIRRVGFGDNGSGVYKTGLYFVGHSFTVDDVYIQGGQRSIHLDRANDLLGGRFFLVGAKNGIWAERANQVVFDTVFLDTCGDDTETTYGLHLDYNCSDWSGKVQTFCSSSASPTPLLTNVLSIGADTSNVSVGINLELHVNNSGGNIMNISYLRDSRFKIVGENTVIPLGGQTNAITTAVVYGTDLAGSVGTIWIDAVLSSSITPYSGTLSGIYEYVMSGIKYINGRKVFESVRTGLAKITGGGTKQWGMPGTAFTSTGTTALTINQVRYIPFMVPHDVTITDFQFEVTAAPASNAKVIVGIYSANSEMQPTGTVKLSNEVSVASGFTGVKTVSSLSVALTPGMYLIAMNCDVTMTLRTISSPTFVVADALGASPFVQRFQVAQTYVTPLPSTGTLWDTINQSAGGAQHVVAFKWTE